MELGCESLDAEDEFVDLRGEQIDAPQDNHVVAVSGDLVHPAHGPGGTGKQCSEIAGAIADDWERLLVSEVNTSSPSDPWGSTRPVSGSMILG
jgi:hypothetical protein